MAGRFGFVPGNVRSETEKDNVHARVVENEPKHERVVQDYAPRRIIKPGTGAYGFTRERFGPLAANDSANDAARDGSRVIKAQKDSRFSLSNLSREPLAIDEEERRAFEARVRAEVDGLSREAFELAKAEGLKQGQAQGHEAGLEEVRQQMADRLESLSSMIESAEHHRRRLMEQQERFFMELVLKIARKVCLKEVATDAAYVGKLMGAMLEQSGARENIRFRISMQDAGTIGQLKKELADRWTELKNVSVEPSSQLAPGSCELETDVESYSASVVSQLEAIEQSMFQRQPQQQGAGA